MDPKTYAELRKLGLDSRWTVGKAKKVVKSFRSERKEISDANIVVMAEAITLSGPAILAKAELQLIDRINQLGRVEAESIHAYMETRYRILSKGVDPASLPPIPECILSCIKDARKEPVILME
jgi:hypothetical protein